MNTSADEHGGGYAGQQRWIWRRRKYGTATDEMWDDEDGEMGYKDGDGMGKYRQRTTAKVRAYRCSRIMGMADNFNSKDSGGRSHSMRCGTKGMDMVVEEMWDGNRRDVGQRR